jgi:tRNA-2-methylthio-N6-dimethylallyladenosine synthase
VNYQRHLGEVLPVMVEGHNAARGQVIGRSTQNKTVNFVYRETSESAHRDMSGSAEEKAPVIGSYVDVRITQIFPNSLVGEAVSQPVAPSSALLAHQALSARVTA